MRSATNRSSSGEVVRSSFETAYQLGFSRQAATVVRLANNVSVIGPCTAKSTRALAGSTPFAKSSRNASSPNWMKPASFTSPAMAGGVGNRLASAA